MNRRQVAGSLLGAVALSAAPSLALAQRRAPMDRMKMPILMGGDFSTATSKLAARMAQSPAVREFAKLEITEQAAVAQAFGARPGTAGLRPDRAAIVAELEAARGAMFDMMYVDGQIAGHRELLDLHRRYARGGSDPMARGASLVGVTGIETHLFLLQNIKRQIA